MGTDLIEWPEEGLDPLLPPRVRDMELLGGEEVDTDGGTRRPVDGIRPPCRAAGAEFMLKAAVDPDCKD